MVDVWQGSEYAYLIDTTMIILSLLIRNVSYLFIKLA